jgi:hypothetical protein
MDRARVPGEVKVLFKDANDLLTGNHTYKRSVSIISWMSPCLRN